MLDIMFEFVSFNVDILIFVLIFFVLVSVGLILGNG